MKLNKKIIAIFIITSTLIKISEGFCAVKALINHPEPLLSLAELETKEAAGDLKAQNELGYYHIDNAGEFRYQLAARWFEKAANQGSFLAQFNLGMLYFTGGFGLTKDSLLAEKWLNQAAKQGFPAAQSALGLLYSSGIGIPKNYEKAFQWHQKASHHGYPDSQKYLSRMYEHGCGVEKNIQKSNLFLKKEFEQKIFREFQDNITVMYKDRPEIEHTACFRWYRKAAGQGYQLTQKKIVKLYENIFPISQNYTDTIEYYRIYADILEISPILSNLGFLYANGYGVKQDYQKALEYYQKAAEQLCSHAQRRLGELYEKGFGVEKDLKKAIEWYEKAAKKLDEEAQNALKRIKKSNKESMKKCGAQSSKFPPLVVKSLTLF